jgi:3-oxoacyl-[acyl-carrier protein] reductase
MDQRLTGQVAIVTGGAGLIGSAISRRLAAEGASVVINGRDEEKAKRLAGTLRDEGLEVAVRIANVRDEGEVAALVAFTLDRYGRLDIVVNNAGGVGTAGAGSANYAAELSPADWQHVLDLNLTAAFLVTRAALPPMIAQEYGRFVNISSAGHFGVIGLANYAAAKAGLVGFTRTVALEYARHGITANVVAPHLTDSGRPRQGRMSEVSLSQVPIKRYGRPEEIAGTVAFFVGPDAGYITGETLHVTGGLQWLGPTLDMPELRRG